MSRGGLDILFNDDRYVAVNKPAGLASIPGPGDVDSVLSVLRRGRLGCRGAGQPLIRGCGVIASALDKETSGVLLFAKDVAAQRHVSHQFQNNQTAKEYLALVAGRPAESRGTIEAATWLGIRLRQCMAVVRHGELKPLRRIGRLNRSFRDYALLRVFPKTGEDPSDSGRICDMLGYRWRIDPLYNVPSSGLFLSRFKRGYRPSGEGGRR